MESASELEGIVESSRQELARFESVYKKDGKAKVRSKGDFRDTYQNCKALLEENPWNLGALRCLGAAASKEGEYELAIYALNESNNGGADLGVTENLGLVYYNYGKELLSDGDYKAAEENLAHVKDTFKDYQGKNPRIKEILKGIEPEILAARYAEGGGPQKLENEAGTTVKLEKQDRGHEIDIGELERILESDDEVNPKKVEAARKIAAHYERGKDYDKALEYLEQAKSFDNGSDSQKEIADLKHRRINSEELPKGEQKTKLEEVKQDYEKLVEARPSDAGVALSLGLVNFKLENWTECIQAIQAHPPAGKDKKDLAEILIGESLLHLGKFEAAELQFQETLTRGKNKGGKTYVEATYGLGRAQEEQKKTKKAIASFSEVIRLDINHKDAVHRIEALKGKE